MKSTMNRVVHPARMAQAARVTGLVPLLVLALAAAPVRADKGGARQAAAVASAAGEGIYRSICQGCHMPDGRGASGAGNYPALAGDKALVSAEFMAMTLLQGRRNMPAFGGVRGGDPLFMAPTLDDEQIAAVVNYVRTHFGNHFKGTLTAVQVKALRDSLPR